MGSIQLFMKDKETYMKAKETVDYTRMRLKILALPCGFKWDVHRRYYKWARPTENIISITVTDDGVFVLFRSEKEHCYLANGMALVDFLQRELK